RHDPHPPVPLRDPGGGRRALPGSSHPPAAPALTGRSRSRGPMCRPVRGTALAALTVMLDSAVNIAFPAISAAFRVPATSIQWVALAYVGAFAVGLLPAGRLADRAGPGWALRAGLAITAGAQLACGLAPAWPGLLAARVVQGVGAALVMAAAPAAVTRGVAADRRAR